MSSMSTDTASMIDFLLYAAIGGVLVALMAGVLGSFVVWQRLAYFGDTLAHSALLGIAFGLMLDIDPLLATVGGCLLLACLLVFMEQRRTLHSDTLLGILAHSSLAIGLVAVSLSDSTRLDLNAYLFGDLLAVGLSDLVLFGVVFTALGCTLALSWNGLLNLTVNTELAAVEGYPVKRLKLLLMCMIALLVAIAMKVIGVLLITALLIIPPASARRLASTPEAMALGAAMIGALSVLGGLALSFRFDTPAGPSVVVMATGLFIASYVLPRRHNHG